MYQTLKDISGKKLIQRSRIEQVMADNTKLYCNSLQRLYDLGFTCSPFYVNDFDFRLAMTQEFPDELELIRSPLDGKIAYTEQTLKYVGYATKNDEFREVVEIYRDLIIARRKLGICEEALNTYRFKRNGTAEISLRVGVSGGITDKTKFKVLPEFLLTDEQPYLWRSSLDAAVYNTICTEIGIDRKTLIEYRDRNKPMFVKGITARQEYGLADVILHGIIPLNGDYGEQLRELMVDYYNKFMLENVRVSVTQLSFESYIYNKSEGSYSGALAEARKQLSSFDVSEIYMTTDTVYYKSSKPHKSSEISDSLYKIGMYSNEFTTDLFGGSQGIFSEERDEQSIPIFLTGCGMRYISEDVDFNPLDENKFLSGLKCKDWEDLFKRTERYSDNELVREFTYALLRARCGHVDYELMSSLMGVDDKGLRGYYEEAICIARDKFKIYDSLYGGAYKC